MTLGASRTVSGAVTAKEWDYLEHHDSKGVDYLGALCPLAACGIVLNAETLGGWDCLGVL